MARTDVPPGHSVSAHRLLGFCCTCPKRSAVEELTAWRATGQQHLSAWREAVIGTGTHDAFADPGA